MKKAVALTSLALFMISTGIVNAQNFNAINQNIKAEAAIREHIDELTDIAKGISRANSSEALDKISKELARQDLMFDSYFSAHMNEFADNSSIMTAVAKYKENRSAVDEKFTARSTYVTAVKAVGEASSCIDKADSLYAKLFKQAQRYSMAKQSSKLLEKVKAKEQMAFAKIQAKYDAAASTAGTIPELENEFLDLEEKFTNISAISESIQKMEFKPLMQRVKDWLMSFAAVAILLMFANMVQSRIAAIKKMKESMKQMEETLNKKDQDIPSI